MRALTICGLWAFALVVQAEDSPPLEEVVVSAMKQSAPIRDTPFTVSSYGGGYTRALESTMVAELFPYMTGVTRGGQSAYDLSLRGFKTTSDDRNAILMDGLPGQAARFGSPLTIGIDHIEVVKGPASVLYGKTQPGGFVNLISKKPLPDAHAEFGVRGSSYWGEEPSGYELTADITGPVTADESLLYRVVAERGDKDSFRDFVYDKGSYLAPSLTWQLSSVSSVTFSGEYRWRRASQDFYLAAPNRDVELLAPITTRYQEPDDYQNEEGYSLGLAFTHGQWKFAARSVRNDDASSWYDPIGVLADRTTLQRRARSQYNQRKSDYFDASYSVPFQTGFIRHQALAGATAGRDSLDAHRKQFFNGATSGPLAKPGPGSLNIDIYNPVYGVSPQHETLPLGQFQRRFTQTQAYGAYLTDYLTLSPRWKAVMGLRQDWEDQRFIERLPNLLPERNKSASGRYPMTGLLFQPDKSWTFYGSYSTSFVPQAPNYQNAAGENPFRPEEGRQFEVGTKASVLSGRVDFTLSLFDIEKRNTLALVTCNTGVAGTCMQEVGQETSRGFELEMEIQPVERWRTALGYSRVDAKVARSSTAAAAPLEGGRLTNAPRDSAHVWSRYQFASGPLRDFSMGLGVIHVGSQVGNLPTAANPRVLILPAYTVVDLAAYYTLTDRYDFTLKIGNVFNELYYGSVGSTLADASVVPGAPRNVLLSVRVPF